MTRALLATLTAAMPGGELRTDQASRLSYGYDNSRRVALADAVAVPADEAEVAAVVRACAEAGVPVVARGMGSATTGAAVPVRGGVVVSFERMRRILVVDPANRLLVAEAGALNAEVQQAAAAVGCFWAPDPTSSAYSTVGGNLACNAGGPRAVKYGAVRDNVLGLRAVTGTGERLRTGTDTTKGAVGYDLTRLLIGSEGTLALITMATLKLTPSPPALATLRAAYRDADAAAAAVARIMAGPVTPCALEFMDATALAIVRDFGAEGIADEAGAMLLVECDGDAARATADLAAVAELARGAGLVALDSGHAAAEREALWRCRRALSPAQRTLKPHKINEDVVVPVSRLPELVRGIERLACEHRVMIVSFGHAGNGNLHVNLLGDDTDLDRRRACLDQLLRLVLALDGTLSGEHGIGYDKRAFVGLEIEPAALAVMRGIKRQFDPRGILNPDKLFPDDGGASV